MAKRKGFGGGFPGGGGFGGNNMNQLLQQAKKMQQEMEKAQEELAQSEIEASSGGGMVKVKINGEHQVLSVEIKPEAVDPDDVEMLEALIVSALNEANRLLAEKTQQTMPSVPGMGGLF